MIVDKEQALMHLSGLRGQKNGPSDEDIDIQIEEVNHKTEEMVNQILSEEEKEIKNFLKEYASQEKA